MNLLSQFWKLSLFYILGELITKVVPSPLPGNVLGFILLVIALKAGFILESKIDTVSDFLLKNLAILFVPGGVGLITVLNLFNGNVLKIVVIVITTTILTLLATAGTIIFLERLRK